MFPPVISSWRRRLKALLGPHWTVRLRTVVRRQGLPRWGNLRRLRPFSEQFGFERGTPVDRPYISAFFAEHAGCITGDVLEIQSSGYTRRYGQSVRVAHTVDISSAHDPTWCCDLALAEDVIPDERYDCFLLPQTLQHVRHLEPALRNILRVVKPGGTVLASVGGLMPLIGDGPEYWRHSADAWRDVVQLNWVGCDVEVESHGNCLVAVAAMLGLAAEELSPAEMAVHDPRYPVVTTIFCRKTARAS